MASRELPAAGCPKRVFVLSALPLTPTGKVDRAALTEQLSVESAAADAMLAVAGSDAPADGVEVLLMHAWVEVLGVARVHRHSDFTALGGDSIRALQVARYLCSKLRHAEGAPPSRKVVASSHTEEADYGHLPPLFAPVALLQRPILHRYASYLRAGGASAPAPAEAAGCTGETDGEAAGGAETQRIDETEATKSDGAVVAAPCRRAPARSGEDLERGEGEAGWEAEELAVAKAVEIATLASEIGSETVAGATEGSVSTSSTLVQAVLDAAAGCGSVFLARCALSMGAHPAPRPKKKQRGGESVNDGGMAALHLATRNGHKEVVALLLEAKATPTLLSASGMPPLHVAAERPSAVSTLQLLMTAGAPLAMRDDRRQTALHTAARAGNVPALEALLRAGADTELRDRWHRTALHWAVVNGEHGATATLIAAVCPFTSSQPPSFSASRPAARVHAWTHGSKEVIPGAHTRCHPFSRPRRRIACGEWQRCQRRQ